MAGDRPDRPTGGRLIEVLRVRRNVTAGMATGVAIGAGLYAIRMLELLGPAPDRGSPLLFFGLALVLAVSAGGLLAAALTLLTAVQVARRPNDDPPGRDDA